MRHLILSFSLLLSLHSQAQNTDIETGKLMPFFQALADFSENIPYEKVYLHFDNTSYFQDDDIWFKCYVVTSGLNQLSLLSKTLYVELLNPGGEIIDKRILKIENGQCHGDFSLNHIPFYSGFYEVRAYTKYMLNFGEEIIFSRLLPVFDKPKAEGNYEEKKMLRYSQYNKYPMLRRMPEKGKSVNFRFFPEGGNLIQDITSRVAFEATDETGNPIDVTGIVMDDAKQELCRFTSGHEGRGVFTYTPVEGKKKAIAEVEYSGKKYRFDLPGCLPQGIVMEVDNLSCSDSIGVTLRKNGNTTGEIFGLVVLTGCSLQSYACINLKDDKNEINFQIDKTQFPAGASQIVLFNGEGEIICDRLVFTGKNDFLNIQAKIPPKSLNPYELVELEFSVADRGANPVNTTFSLAIRDGENEVEYKHNILTDLLLMSEIKGYVRNPSWYFESDDDTRFTELDLLLMVQGWRRYSWKQMSGQENFEIKYPAEQGIETSGQIVSSFRKIPKPDVDVTMLLQQKREEDEEADVLIETFVSDKDGRFSFVSDVPGRWGMILSVKEKGKKKDHRILLDRLFNPDPKQYRYADMQVNIKENNENIIDKESPDEIDDELDSVIVAYMDSLSKADITKKVFSLPEVTVKAKKNTQAADIRRNRSTSTVYYDMPAELDNIYDKGKYIGNDIHQMLLNTNKEFFLEHVNIIIPKKEGKERLIEDYLHFKGKLALFVNNYEVVKLAMLNPPKILALPNIPMHTPWNDYFDYRYIKLSSIKDIYINENKSVIAQYIYPFNNAQELAELFGCVVFIETYPVGQIPAEGAKGVRKTWLEGYSQVKEFYSADYSSMPLEADYRRTLYWNPSVFTDENGCARISFYNNSSCRNFSISVETLTSQGMIGVYKKE